MLGFGEEEAREIEKRKERQGSLFWRKKEMAGVCVLEEGGLFCIYRVLEKVFFAFMFIYFFLCLCFFFFLKYCADVENCESFKSFGYIYIYIYIYMRLEIGERVTWLTSPRILLQM